MVMRRVVKLTAFGAPQVLSIVREALTPLAPGEVRVRQTAIGFNFIDIYQRKGVYPLPLPTGLGFEAAGVVDAVGSEVAGIRVGEWFFGFPAIDALVPLLAFLFLVALGVDYTMFLAHRTL